jgi:hypothetical protein
MESEDYQAPQTNDETEQSDTLSKTETVELLQQSIQELERIITRLNVEEESNLPAPSSIRDLVETTAALATTTKKPEPVIDNSQSDATEESPEILQAETTQVVTQPEIYTPSQPTKTQTIPVKKTKIKPRRLPIVPIVAALVVAIALGTWLWLSRPLPQFVAETAQPASDKITESLPEKDIANSEIPQEIITPTSQPVSESKDLVTDNSATENTTEIDVPTDLIAPGKSKTVAVKSFPVEVVLTPEQKLIAVVRDKIAALSQQYPQDVVSSVEANFRDNSLLVTISDRWYELDADAQNLLAKDIFKRSQELDFQKLMLQDSARNLLARNPVVGNDMVVFRREVIERAGG